MADFIFRKYKHEDKEQVLKLLGNALWHFPYVERLAYFNWKYEQNPYTDAPLGFVCLDGDKVIAFRGYMLQPISINEKVYYNAALADTVTDSSYRRMGLFSRITKFSIEEMVKDARIVVSTNSSSGGPTLNGYLKLGWCPLIERKNLFSFSWRGLLPSRPIVPERIADKGIHSVVMSVKCRASEMAVLARKQLPKTMISVYTDEEYIKWRFSNPHAEYFFIYYYIKNCLTSYVVVKKIGERKYDIVDFHSQNSKQLKILIKSLHCWLRPLYILDWTVNRNDAINLSPLRFSFVSLDFVLKHIAKFNTPPFLIRTTKMNQQDCDWIIDGMDIRNPKNWFLNKIVADEI